MLTFACLCLAAVALAADQALKFHITATLPLGEARPLLPGLVQLETVHNYGAAWSSFSGQRWFLIGLTAAIMILVAVLLLRRRIQHPLGYIALTLILAGGVGNLVDRIRLGYVVDMFSLQFFSFPVFNVADICITCGCGLGLIYYFLLHEEKEAAKEPTEEAAAETAEEPAEETAEETAQEPAEEAAEETAEEPETAEAPGSGAPVTPDDPEDSDGTADP